MCMNFELRSLQLVKFIAAKETAEFSELQI
jgi:hypothetical protein